jgi:glycosyltransferase involved in cell wall biosynthesis
MAADTQAVQAIANQQTVAAGRILFVGRLVEKKGLAVLLDAIRLLPSGRIELNVVGDGPLRAELERQASGLPVSFLGGLSASELAQQYGQAEIVVFPSVRALSGDQDGLPVALLEAMAAGCAVVGTDLPGLRDAIQDGISGLLVPSGNAKALASALHQAMADPVGRAKLGRGAKARSLDYSVDVIGDQYIALLDQVRSRYPRSGPDGDQR